MALMNFLGRKPQLKWQKLRSDNKRVPDLYRSAVHGGWLICNGDTGGLTFIPDPHYEWDGESYPIFEK